MEIIISLFVITIFLIIGWTFWGNISIYVDVVQIDATNHGVTTSSQNYTEIPMYF